MTEGAGRAGGSPWQFVPSLALFQALSAALISVLPGIFLKTLGASNSLVGLATLFYLPVAFRFLFGVVVDRVGTKRLWSLGGQAASVLLSAALAGWVLTGGSLGGTLWIFGLGSLIAALLDLSLDGYFLLVTTTREKAFFANLKVQAFRLGNLLANGGYVILAGFFLSRTGSATQAWGWVFTFHALISLLLLMWNFFFFPREIPPVPPKETSAFDAGSAPGFMTAITTFVRQPGALFLIAYILVYRVGESLLATMKIPFMLDPLSEGGLGLTLEQVGLMNGTIVMGVLMAAGLIGGLWVQRKGLASTLLPAVFLMNTPNLLFVYLALHPPSGLIAFFGFSLQPLVLLVLIIEAIGYALAFAPYIYLQTICVKGPYQTTLFALVSGIMNIGWIAPAAVSGFIQAILGYPMTFLLSCLLGFSALFLIKHLPLSALEERTEKPTHTR